jgi:hypothetical protein
MIADYNKNMVAANQEIQDINNQKVAAINEYNSNYNNQLNEYNDLMNQQQANINTYKQTQEDLLDKQLARNNETIEQNRKETTENINKEKKDAYVDYMKQINQYGGAQEQLASQGLATTGYAESSKVAMYNTYQNRVSAANTALTKANVEYDNQMKDAVLNNDVAKAQIALDTLQKSYELALKGFEYKNTLFNQKMAYTQDLENMYYNRANTAQSRIDNYKSAINNIYQTQEKMAEEKRQFDEQMAEKKREYDQNFAEEQRQFNQSLSLSKKKASSGGSLSLDDLYGSGNGGVSLNTPTQSSNKDVVLTASKTYSPNLSNKTANAFFDSLAKYYTKNGMYVINSSTLENLLNQGLDKNIITKNDYKKIANYFGVSAE